MLNLLPKEEKKRIARDFYLRFSIVLFITLALGIFVGGVLLTPSYFLSVVGKDDIDKKLEIQKNAPALENEEINTKILKELNNKISLIENIKDNKFIVSERVINAVVLRKMSDIKISQISYITDNQGKKIIINGLAPSRERLLLFKKSLEDDLAFKKVDLPISNFVKGSNIQFTLTLTPS